MLDVLEKVQPNKMYVRGSWEEQMSDEQTMLADMEDSWVIPCPEGNNTESFRIYEALEAEAFPVLCNEERGEWSHHFYLWLQRELPSICIIHSWEDIYDLFHKIKENPDEFSERRDRLVGEWCVWKKKLQKNAQQLLELLS
jgi:hypothetical protein